MNEERREEVQVAGDLTFQFEPSIKPGQLDGSDELTTPHCLPPTICTSPIAHRSQLRRGMFQREESCVAWMG